jgi:stearoyl-CoA desaturase (delta-9 desaturase)
MGTFTLVGLLFGPLTATPGAVWLCGVSLLITLCCGHSVGLHRLFIHRSFRTPLWLEHLLVWMGVLVGMGGPLSMMAMHNTRDALQSGPGCPDYFAHRASIFRDYLEQFYGRFVFETPFTPRMDSVAQHDRFYVWLERTWRWQQLVLALLLFTWGGWGFVVWGVCIRIAVGATGHWFVGHLVHNRGYRNFEIDDVSLAAWNDRWLGALAMGEGWHNNHHAFPHSARLGLLPGEIDPGWMFIRLLARLGLATDIQLPASKPTRHPVHVVGGINAEIAAARA